MATLLHDSKISITFRPCAEFLVCAALVALLGLAGFSSAMAEQTREQCNECCKGQNSDEYYLEQCRLKCFRNNDHCLGHQKRQPPQEAATQPQVTQPAQPSPAQPPPAQPERQVTERREPATPKFRWPNPLNLVPGKEFEAAGQILAANGVSPQHPQYQAGLKAIEGVLAQFAQANPSGGRLPTAQLEGIIRQLR